MPFVWMPLMVLTLLGLPAEKVASAAGIFNFVRMVASSLGTAVGVTLWDDRTIFHHSRIVESIPADSPQHQQAMELLSQRLPDSQAALAALDAAVNAQARTLGLDDLFYVSAILLMPLALVAWLLPARGTDTETTP